MRDTGRGKACMDRREIDVVLRGGGLRPRHRYGQNFMVDQRVLAALVEAGEIHDDDILLEVGPGVGNLTRLLARAARGVLAVDIDKGLLDAAAHHHRELENVVWMRGDVLAGKHEVDPGVIAKLVEMWAGRGAIRLVSNLPYNAASPLVAELLVTMWRDNRRDQHVAAGASATRSGIPVFAMLAFTVQWEVAERLAAPPGGHTYGPLGVLVQAMAGVKIVRKIPPGAFWPAPKVNSALVRVRPDLEKIRRIGDAVALERLLAGVFGHRRQKLSNGLKHYLGPAWTPDLVARVRELGIDLNHRPEMLSVQAFLSLSGALPSEQMGRSR